MRRYLPTTFALLFLFVFVFAMSANFNSAVSGPGPGSYKCLGCCVIPPANGCTAEYGQIFRGRCSCMNYVYCMPSPCDFWCKVCY